MQFFRAEPGQPAPDHGPITSMPGSMPRCCAAIPKNAGCDGSKARSPLSNAMATRRHCSAGGRWHAGRRRPSSMHGFAPPAWRNARHRVRGLVALAPATVPSQCPALCRRSTPYAGRSRARRAGSGASAAAPDRRSCLQQRVHERGRGHGILLGAIDGEPLAGPHLLQDGMRTRQWERNCLISASPPASWSRWRRRLPSTGPAARSTEHEELYRTGLATGPTDKASSSS